MGIDVSVSRFPVLRAHLLLKRGVVRIENAVSERNKELLQDARKDIASVRQYLFDLAYPVIGKGEISSGGPTFVRGEPVMMYLDTLECFDELVSPFMEPLGDPSGFREIELRLLRLGAFVSDRMETVLAEEAARADTEGWDVEAEDRYAVSV